MYSKSCPCLVKKIWVSNSPTVTFQAVLRYDAIVGFFSCVLQNFPCVLQNSKFGFRSSFFSGCFDGNIFKVFDFHRLQMCLLPRYLASISSPSLPKIMPTDSSSDVPDSGRSNQSLQFSTTFSISIATVVLCFNVSIFYMLSMDCKICSWSVY